MGVDKYFDEQMSFNREQESSIQAYLPMKEEKWMDCGQKCKSKTINLEENRVSLRETKIS